MSWNFSQKEYNEMAKTNEPLARLLRMAALDSAEQWLQNEVLKMRRKKAMDAEERWVTVHPNGAENKGRKVKIDNKTGNILAGLGGEHKGEKINAIKNKSSNKSSFKLTGKGNHFQKNAKMKEPKKASGSLDIPQVRQQVNSTQQSNLQNSNLQNRNKTQRVKKVENEIITGSLKNKGNNIKTNTGIKIKPTGKVAFAKTAKGNKIKTQYALVDASNLITSHDPSNGKVNAKFPQELQPRDRSRSTSMQWVQKISKDIDPEQLGGSRRADSGAPIIGDDGIVESGNGRTMALLLAYQNGNADDYRDWLEETASYFNINPDEVSKMKQPVLVRVRQSDVDRAAFAVEANQDDKLGMTATEKAKADEARITPDLISKLHADGDLTSLENADFIKGFLTSLGTNEAAQYITSNNRPTQSLIARVQAALFSKAYNDDRLLELTADTTDPEIKNILNGLNGSASEFIKMRQSDKDSGRDTGDKTTKTIIDAINMFKTAKEKGMSLERYLKQIDMFDKPKDDIVNTAELISKYNRSGKKLSALFNGIASAVRRDNEDSRTGSMFGGNAPLKYGDILASVNRSIESEEAKTAKLKIKNK